MTYSYLYAGGRLLQESIPSYTLYFTYQSDGTPYSMTHVTDTASATYYYIVNLQGDVMYLIDANSKIVATYTYDPYGKVLTAEGTMAELNPLRYRGYYYDAETGFYYLQSRYYDPAICRFISGDGFASTGQGFIGHNMFAYCNNAPVNNTDSSGSAMQPCFTLSNDGAYFSAVFVSTGTRESDLLKHHANNPHTQDETDGVLSVIATCVQVGDYTKTNEWGFLNSLGSSLIGSAVGALVGKAGTWATAQVAATSALGASVISGVATATVAAAGIYVLENVVSYISGSNIPVGTYEQFAVITVERYPYTGSTGNYVWREVTRVTLYIDLVIGVNHEWVCVGNGQSSERLIGFGG